MKKYLVAVSLMAIAAHAATFVMVVGKLFNFFTGLSWLTAFAPSLSMVAFGILTVIVLTILKTVGKINEPS